MKPCAVPVSDEGVIGTVVSVIGGLVGCGHRPGPNIRTNALFALQLRLPDVVAMQSGRRILKVRGCRTNRRRVTAIRWAGAGLVIEKIIGWPTTLWQPTATS